MSRVSTYQIAIENILYEALQSRFQCYNCAHATGDCSCMKGQNPCQYDPDDIFISSITKKILNLID